MTINDDRDRDESNASYVNIEPIIVSTLNSNENTVLFCQFHLCMQIVVIRDV